MYDYKINKNMTIHLPKEARHPIILELLKNYTTGVEWKACFDAKENTILIGNIDPISADGEDYALSVTDSGAFVVGSTYGGLMRGFVTLLERIVCNDFESYIIEGGLEKKSPKIKFRSIHFCVFPETKLTFLRKETRLAIMGKYSHIIIEFWGTLKMDSFSLLGWDDAYTKSEIKEIMDEIKAFGIEIVPFFQHWGHAALSRGGAGGKHVVLNQDIRYEYLYKPHTGGWVWDFKKPQVLELLKDVRNELIELCGEGQYFHLGCDEAEKHVSIDEALAVVNHINTVAEDLKEKGRRAIIWGDMLLSKSFFVENSKYECNASLEIANAMLDRLSRDVIIADWQYNINNEKWESSKLFKEKGFDVICCPFDGRLSTSKAVETAFEWEMLGFMKTTWHTLHSSNMAQIIQSGWGSYDGVIDPNYHVFSPLISRVTGILCKIRPQIDNYTEYGWKEKQIEI